MTDANRPEQGDDVVAACPECDSASLSTRNSSGARGRRTTQEYYCQDCRTTFDEPVIRERRHSGRCRGLAGRLEDADPDDFATGGGDELNAGSEHDE